MDFVKKCYPWSIKYRWLCLTSWLSKPTNKCLQRGITVILLYSYFVEPRKEAEAEATLLQTVHKLEALAHEI